MKKHTLFIIIIIVVALGIGIWRDKQGSNSIETAKQFTANPLKAGTYIVQSKKLPPFTLTDTKGKSFTQQSLKKQWSFIFFGYSRCPDICPATLGTLHEVSQRLQSVQGVQYIFVTIDPKKDTKKRLRKYLKNEKYKGTRFIGLTGSEEKIKKFAQNIGAYAEDKETSGHIEHSGTIFLVSPEGKLVAVFTGTNMPQTIVSDFKEVVHRYASTS